MPFYRMPDGESLFVREYGQGQPVLVLSGLGMLSWQWAAFLYPHQKKFRFIIPEWRGFGASSRCKIPQDLDAISSHWQDVRSVLTQLKLDQVIVIAYSMGATTCKPKIEMSGFSKVKMSAFRICTFAISLADGLICWCLCRIKNLNDCRSCRKSVINA